MKWDKAALRRQIEYGSRLGQINLHEAIKEFDNFFQYEKILVEYFKKEKMLYLVSDIYVYNLRQGTSKF